MKGNVNEVAFLMWKSDENESLTGKYNDLRIEIKTDANNSDNMWTFLLDMDWSRSLSDQKETNATTVCQCLDSVTSESPVQGVKDTLETLVNHNNAHHVLSIIAIYIFSWTTPEAKINQRVHVH